MKRSDVFLSGYKRIEGRITKARHSAEEKERLSAARSMLRRSIKNNFNTGIGSHNDGDGFACARVVRDAYKAKKKEDAIIGYIFPPEGKKIPRNMCALMKESKVESCIITDLSVDSQFSNRINNLRQALYLERGYGTDLLMIDHHPRELFQKFRNGEDWEIAPYMGNAYKPDAEIVDFLDCDIDPRYGLLLEVSTRDHAAVIPTWEICKEFVNKKKTLPWVALGVLCDRAHDTQKGVEILNQAFGTCGVDADKLKTVKDVVELLSYVRKDSAPDLNEILLSLEEPCNLIDGTNSAAAKVMKDYEELYNERSRLVMDYGDNKEEVAPNSFYYELNSNYNIGVPVINKLADMNPHDIILVYYPKRKRCYFRKGGDMGVVKEAISYCMKDKIRGVTASGNSITLETDAQKLEIFNRFSKFCSTVQRVGPN